MQKAVRLSCLHAVWISTFRITTSQSKTLEHVSKAVHVQLAALVSQGIVDLEKQILSKLQELLFTSSKGPGKSNMLPLWACLWLLILTYRRTIEGRPVTVSKNQRGLDLAKHMYDMIVSIYSALFRPSSPLLLNWLKEDVFELFGKDYRLTHTLATLKTEYNFIR